MESWIWIFLTVVQILNIISYVQPCFTEVQVVHYNTERYCASWFFFVCLKYRYRTRAYYSLEKRCCHGYTGNLCTTPICSCQNGGTCVAPNICRCSSEYEGNSCQTPRCYPSCHHGHCVSPNRCSCNTGYTGSTCSQPVCNPPCHYGGVCIGVNSCRCPSNQAGPYCRQPLCNPACLNGGSCTYGHTCDCSGTHYTGIKCETPVCNPPCQSGGTCVSPNTCQCPSSHAGPHCNQPLCNPACLNGGVCTSSHTCNCSDTQYTGARCEIPVCNPACRNGGSCVAPNKCVCTEQHTGTTCNIPVCSPECANGGVCTQQHVCNCSETLYTGTTCETPVCDPACRNGGACVSPNRCYCTETYTGASCEIPMCAHHHPCFPGECNNMIHCRCTYGFSGEGGLERCKTFDANNIPVITKCMSVLSNIERTGKKRELYKYITDSSEPNSTKVDMLWLNQKDYNYINADFTAMYVPPDGIAPPIYVTDFAFGIVGAYLRIDLYKVHRNSSDKAFVSLNSTTYPCPNQPGSNNPNEAVYSCNVTHHDFDRLLENGDNLTVTVIAQNGGYRKLKTSSTTNFIDHFKGRNSSKSMMYRFDFRNPQHCVFDTHHKCSLKAFTVNKDITRDPIYIEWDGWSDVLSGIEKYIIEIYLLKPNQNVNPILSEPDPWSPMNTLIFNSTARGYNFVFLIPGMYSLILNVVDKANNSEYARKLVLYDNTSSISIDNSSPMISTSAVKETNYQWQNNLTNDISISWEGHFRNKFHENNKLLNQVTDFKHFDHDKGIQKIVHDVLDDNDGERTLNAIPNVHGIVKFEYAYGNANQGNQTPTNWQIIIDLNQTVSFFVQRQNGDTLNVWIRATDSVGNSDSDIMHVYFDETPPTALTKRTVEFKPNLNNSVFSFSSRLRVDAHDRESGIFKIDWEFISNKSGIIFKAGSMPGNKTESLPHFVDGYKVPMGDFFFFSHYLDVNNCWMIVPKDTFNNEFLKLKLVVYNRAMESTSFETTLIYLRYLHGIDEYSGPSNLFVEKKYDNSVRLKWTLTSTCYERTKITLSAKSENGEKFSRIIDEDADHFDLTGLEPGTTYNLSFITEYGEQKSNPVFLVFRTSLTKTSAALTAGGIAGISIAMILIPGIIIGGMIAWKKWKSCFRYKEQTYEKKMADEDSLSATSEPPSAIQNDAYNDEVEIDPSIDLYEDMNESQEDHQINFCTLFNLETLLKTGDFAVIYKFKYPSSDESQGADKFIAKVLKKPHTSREEEIMTNKIDFYRKIGKHQNILGFVESVYENKDLGPYMILEFCNIGQLDIWLIDNKKKAYDRTFEMQLCKIVNGICDGMLHLEIKKLVHKSLAARNVLLNKPPRSSSSELIPKIYGFCPTPKIDEDGNEQIPIQSAAPEYFESATNLTSKSDVWSFGVVLWEIFSLGEEPYRGKTREGIRTFLNNGNRLRRPKLDFNYDLMTMCWHRDAGSRPTFEEIKCELEAHPHTLKAKSHYE